MGDFLGVLVIEVEDAAAADDGRGEAFADGPAPDDFRLDGQGLRYGFTGGDVAGAGGAAPLRPIGGEAGRNKEREDGEDAGKHGRGSVAQRLAGRSKKGGPALL